MKHFFWLFLLVAAGCSNKPAANPQAGAEAAPLAVRVAAAETRTLDRSLSVTGSLAADETVNLGFEVPGNLQRVHVDFGQPVKQGQLLAELDTRELTWQAERTRAALSQALARIGLKPGQEEATPEATPNIRQAQAQLEDVRFKFESAQKLVKSGDIARERYNEIEKAYYARQAALEAARDELRTQLAAIQGLRAELRLAEKRLGDARLYAPFDGAVAARLVSPGQYIRENTPVFTIVKTRPLRLRLEIPEAAAAEARKGSSLTFTTDAAPGKAFHAVVRELNPALDARSRSLTAEARLVEADARLKPGTFVQVTLVTARQMRVTVVPKEALYTIAGLTKVFAVRDGVVLEYKVQPGEELGGWVVIPDVLRPGERVITSNLGALVAGMKVTVKG
ncbi:MAG: efflux RND transporter periplasmic adaptor subunit [Bryobacteraceae bacterium]